MENHVQSNSTFSTRIDWCELQHTSFKCSISYQCFMNTIKRIHISNWYDLENCFFIDSIQLDKTTSIFFCVNVYLNVLPNKTVSNFVYGRI